jgi:ornithine carbamoyltransferase
VCANLSPTSHGLWRGYVDIIIGRVFSHVTLEQLASSASVPVVNGLSDVEHPCQVIADLLTLRESFGDLAGRTLAFVGDGNNVAGSLMLAAPMVGMNVCIASPAGYEPADVVVATADQLARSVGGWVEVCRDPAAAVRTADVVYADAWYSMGQEHEADVRRGVFRPYQVNRQLL